MQQSAIGNQQSGLSAVLLMREARMLIADC
jgi:hypothetical protein